MSGGASVGVMVIVPSTSPDAGRPICVTSIDRGVDTVHVWAYPVNERGEREAPSFLGAAAYGGARPDVAAIYGEHFLDTGYGMIARLEPAVYDVALFAYSTATGGFVPAKTVRVTVRQPPKHG